MKKEIEDYIINSSEIAKNSLSISDEIERSINAIVECLDKGKKIVLFGNGGSAADAQHIAAELIGRFKAERKSYPAIALSTDSSVLTSLSNDYSFDVVFSRQCESLVVDGDVVIGISTSGNSTNVEKALEVSKSKGATTIGLLGNKGGKIRNVVDIPIVVDSSSTPKIQEVHRIVYHVICEMVEKIMVKKWTKKDNQWIIDFSGY